MDNQVAAATARPTQGPSAHLRLTRPHLALRARPKLQRRAHQVHATGPAATATIEPGDLRQVTSTGMSLPAPHLYAPSTVQGSEPSGFGTH